MSAIFNLHRPLNKHTLFYITWHQFIGPRICFWAIFKCNNSQTRCLYSQTYYLVKSRLEIIPVFYYSVIGKSYHHLIRITSKNASNLKVCVTKLILIYSKHLLKLTTFVSGILNVRSPFQL